MSNIPFTDLARHKIHVKKSLKKTNTIPERPQCGLYENRITSNELNSKIFWIPDTVETEDN